MLSVKVWYSEYSSITGDDYEVDNDYHYFDTIKEVIDFLIGDNYKVEESVEKILNAIEEEGSYTYGYGGPCSSWYKSFTIIKE
jgi:hypothetical protein